MDRADDREDYADLQGLHEPPSLPGLIGAALWSTLCWAVDGFAEACDRATPLQRFGIAALLVACACLMAMGAAVAAEDVSDWLKGVL